MTHDDEGKAKEGRGEGDATPSLADRLAVLMDVRRQPDGRRWNSAALARAASDQFHVKVSKEMVAGILRGDQQNPGSDIRNALAELLGVPLEFFSRPINDRIRGVIAQWYEDLLCLQREAGPVEEPDTGADAGGPVVDEEALTTTAVLGVSQQVKLIAAGIAAEAGVNQSQAEALLQLANAKRCMTIGEFGEACRTPSATTSRNADALAAEGLIREDRDTNRRKRSIEITPKGREIVDRHTRVPADEFLEALGLASMDPAERAVAWKVLGALAGRKSSAAASQTSPGEVDGDSREPPGRRGVA